MSLAGRTSKHPRSRCQRLTSGAASSLA
jgi:hypothetical protein